MHLQGAFPASKKKALVLADSSNESGTDLKVKVENLKPGLCFVLFVWFLVGDIEPCVSHANLGTGHC